MSNAIPQAPQVTQSGGTIHLFFPLQRYDEQKHIAEGYAYVNEVVEGEGGVRLRRSAMEAATADYLKYGVVREMHGPNAAGTATPTADEDGCGVFWDQKGAFLRVRVVDPVAQEKCRAGVYKGFSVGVRPSLMRGKDVESCRWVETSLVDRPKDPDALFSVYRAAEVEESMAKFQVGDRVRHAEGGEGVLTESLSHHEPATHFMMRVDGGAQDTLVSYDLLERLDPTPAAAGEEAEAPGTPVAEERAETTGEPADAEPEPVDRGLTSSEVPSRENLEGGEKDAKKLHAERHFDCGSRSCHGHLQHAAAVRCQEAREGAAERGEVAELLRCGGCGCPVTGGADGVYPFLAENPQSMSEVQILSFEDRLNPAVRQGNFRQAFQALASSLFEISLWESGDKEVRAREALSQFADFVAPLVAGDPETQRALFAPFLRADLPPENRGDTLAAVKKIVAAVPEGQGLDVYLSPDGKQVFCSWGDWADSEAMDQAQAALTELLGAEQVEFEAEASGPEGWQVVRSERTKRPERADTLTPEEQSDTSTLQADLSRLETTNTDLLQRLATLEGSLTTEREGLVLARADLATAQQRVKDLESAPALLPPYRYGAAGVERTFAVNRLMGDGGPDVSTLQAEHAQLNRDLKNPDLDRNTRDAGVRRLLTLQQELGRHGVVV